MFWVNAFLKPGLIYFTINQNLLGRLGCRLPHFRLQSFVLLSQWPQHFAFMHVICRSAEDMSLSRMRNLLAYTKMHFQMCGSGLFNAVSGPSAGDLCWALGAMQRAERKTGETEGSRWFRGHNSI